MSHQYYLLTAFNNNSNCRYVGLLVKAVALELFEQLDLLWLFEIMKDSHEFALPFYND